MRSRINKRNTRAKPSFKLNIEINYAVLTKTIVTLILYIIIFAYFSNYLQRTYAINQFEENIDDFAKKNADTIFEVKEIILYSSAVAKSSNEYMGLDISAFTDISFNIENPKNKTIKSLKIRDIEISPVPELRRNMY